MLETVEGPPRTAAPPAPDSAGERGVVVAPVKPRARFSLRLREASARSPGTAAGFDLALPINRFSAGARAAARLGPDEWLLLAPDQEARTVQAEIETALAGRLFSLVDIGHRNAAFTVSGPQAEAVLNAGCPLPLDEPAFPVGAATRTVLAKAEIVLLRVEALGFELECGRSFAGYIDAFLNEAARDHG